MKKILLVLTGIFLSLSVYAKTFRVGDFEYETDKKSLYTNGVNLKKDYSQNQDVIIPATVDYGGVKYTVSKIDNNAFKDNKNIREVTVPGSVYVLDSFAFKGLKSLRNIKVLAATQDLDNLIIHKLKDEKNLPLFIPDLVIGFSTFANCESLETIDFTTRNTLIAIPKNLYGTKAWGSKYPFENCRSLKTVISGDIDFSAENLKAFKGCHQLETVITGTVNPSKYKKLFEKDSPFMTRIFPKISGMSDEEYLSYLNNNNKTAKTEEEYVHNSKNSLEQKTDESTNQSRNLRLSEDIMTVPMQRKDLNGNVCALIKVIVDKKGLTFEGNVIGSVEQKTGNQYWVYVSPGTKKVRINVPGQKPHILDLDEYKDFHALESKRIYEYSFETEPTQNLTLSFTPKEATVLIDGSLYDSENGTIIVDLPLGEHSYIVASKGYITSEGIIKLNSSGPSNINVHLNQSKD